MRVSRIVVLLALVLSDGCGGDTPVVAPPAPVPASVTISPGSARLDALGVTVQLTATVHDQYGQVMSGALVIWASDDASIASVSGSGLVTAVGNGSVSITATSGSVSGGAVVTVEQVVAVIEVTPASETLSAIGDTIRLAAQAFDGRGHAVAAVALGWQSSDTSVATVDSVGLVTAVGNGDANVAVTAGSATSKSAITVKQVVVAIEVAPASETLSAIGDTIRLAAQAFDGRGHAVAAVALGWSSSDTLVATVDSTGLVTAVGNGEATVTATSGAATSNAVVTVNQVVAAIRVFPDAATLWLFGDTLRLSASGLDARDNAVADAEFIWSSDEDSVATVDNRGLVTAVGNGTVAIEAASGSAKASATVRVAQKVREALVALYDVTGGRSWENSDNWLTDAPPGSWYGVTADATDRITALRLEKNNLQGPIPPELGRLTDLRVLSLSFNDLTGAIPEELGLLSELNALALNSNDLLGPIPSSIGLLSGLEALVLNHNELTGQIPSALGGLANLVSLQLHANQLDGPIPSELGNLTRLEHLSLEQNRHVGPIPPSLENLVNLEHLSLSSNELTGSVPPWLATLRRLRRVRIGSNNLTGSIPPELGSLANLVVLGLGGNALTGPIPREMENLYSLEYLYLLANGLTGSIPSELGSLANLKVLWLSSNALTGSIPPEFAKLTRLQQLNLTNNDLGGLIPPELGNLTDLRVLHLGNNGLTGTIPLELGNLTSLVSLSVRHNFLAGPIPPELGNLTVLEDMILNGNRFSGIVPDTFLQIPNLRTFWWGDNDGLCVGATSAFRSWLQSIESTNGRYC